MKEIDEAIARGERSGWWSGEHMSGKWWLDENDEVQTKSTVYHIDWEKIPEPNKEESDTVNEEFVSQTKKTEEKEFVVPPFPGKIKEPEEEEN